MSSTHATPIRTNGTNGQKPPRARGTLLIVDDEEGPRQSLRIIFKDDYELLLAADGATAIELARQHDIDAAICDIRMAGMSGIEVLERLKFVDRGIEVVMITAFETTDTIRQALRFRACDYINKPFDVGSMRAAVARAMERRSVESEFHHHAEQLQSLRIELQNHEIGEQIAQTRGDIYASIIHDINSPLTSISGFVQSLNQRVGKTPQLGAEDVEFIKDRLKATARQVTNCIEISRRYLSFLRRDTDETPHVGVNQVFTDLGHLLNLHPSLLHSQFNLHPLAEDIVVQIHGTDLIQILQNLAVNAFQSSPRGCQVEIAGEILREPLDASRFQDRPGERWLNVEQFANTAPLVRLSVRDTGPGIPPEVLPKIFQPYFSTKSPRQGTGLGLSIVHRLIREAATALHVRTNVGEGTTFTLYIPATPTTE